jgi:hypothetical protein
LSQYLCDAEEHFREALTMLDRLHVLEFLKQAAMLLREAANDAPADVTGEILRMADEIRAEANELEAELAEAGGALNAAP